MIQTFEVRRRGPARGPAAWASAFAAGPRRGIILQWPEEQSRSGCGQDGGDADQLESGSTSTALFLASCLVLEHHN